MKKTLYIVLFAAIAQMGCKKFSEFQVDPNKTTAATPDLLLNAIEQSAFQSTNLDVALASRQMINTDEITLNQYYGWSRGSYANYNNLRQVVKMEQAAINLNKPQYLPLVKFF